MPYAIMSPEDLMPDGRGSNIPKLERAATTLVQNASGITLIEVLISSLIIGIAAVGLALMFANGQVVIAGEGGNRVGVYLAQQKIELCQRVGFQKVDDAVGPPPSPCLATDYFNQDLTAGTASDHFFQRTGAVDLVCGNDYTATSGCPASPPQAKRITVTVQRGPRAPKDVRPVVVVLTSVLANR
jgi:Tfp pilus assembly protein PilV